MLVPVEWINDYIDLSDVSTEEFCDRMIMSGSNLETCDWFCEDAENIVVGKIEKIEVDIKDACLDSDGAVRIDRRSMGGSWYDSGINALSFLDELVDLSNLQATLDELGAEIKKGDYIGIQVKPDLMYFWSVQNDGRVNYDNAHTQWGTIPLYRTITCAPVDKNEIGL